MQCFICVMYMIIVTSANPAKTREIAAKPDKRSLFNDVLESFRIRVQQEDVGQNEENNLAHNFVRYGFENDQQLQGDTGYTPRRNDRLEMPSMKNRFPKSIETDVSQNKNVDTPKDEVIVYENRNISPKMGEYLGPIKNKNHSNKRKYAKSDHAATGKQIVTPNVVGNKDSKIVDQPSLIDNIPEEINIQNTDPKAEIEQNDDTIIDIIRKFLSIYQEIVVKEEVENEGAKKKGVNKKKYDVNLELSKGKTSDENSEAKINKSGKKIQKYQKYDDVLHVLFSI